MEMSDVDVIMGSRVKGAKRGQRTDKSEQKTERIH
jgi:hypothetical protein